jgi:hypothetical protein
MPAAASQTVTTCSTGRPDGQAPASHGLTGAAAGLPLLLASFTQVSAGPAGQSARPMATAYPALRMALHHTDITSSDDGKSLRCHSRHLLPNVSDTLPHHSFNITPPPPSSPFKHMPHMIMPCWQLSLLHSTSCHNYPQPRSGYHVASSIHSPPARTHQAQQPLHHQQPRRLPVHCQHRLQGQS